MKNMDPVKTNGMLKVPKCTALYARNMYKLSTVELQLIHLEEDWSLLKVFTSDTKK